MDLASLSSDPYPHYRRLREREPVSWVPALNMYLVTRYDLVQTVLRDSVHYISGTDRSLVYDTFGTHMLTTDGELHDLYKQPLLPGFRPAAVRESMELAITAHVNRLIDGFIKSGRIELREHFASRLPILTVLSLFGLPLENEPLLRRWYDAFENALANFTWQANVRAEAATHVGDFHTYMQGHIDAKRKAPDDRLLSQLLAVNEPRKLADDEIRRNALIIFFGGISTVEALILNTFYSLHRHPETQDRVIKDLTLCAPLLDEVVRWLGPVQSATRHVSQAATLAGVSFAPGDTVNCMLAAANQDPEVFTAPDQFNIDRPELRRHVGFAIGSHHCLGSHLAKLEARIAVETLLQRLPHLRVDPASSPVVSGHEFRQPKLLSMCWEPPA